MQRNLRSVEVGIIDFKLLFESGDGRRVEAIHCMLAPVGEQFQIRQIRQKHWKGSTKHERPEVMEVGPLLASEEEGLQQLARRYQYLLGTAERYENTLLHYLKLNN